MHDDTLNSILRRIIMEPYEDIHRLVYADRLDELGQSARAKFIRQSIEFAGRGYECYTHPTTYDVGCYLPLPEGMDCRWAEFDRGFMKDWVTDAETFLRHADALIWHETQTLIGGSMSRRCGNPRRGNRFDSDHMIEDDGEACTQCGQCCIPRPCPSTAQPIRRVVLTACDDWDSFCTNNEFSVLNTTGVVGEGVWTSPKWAGVEFELPTVGTEASSEDEWNDHEVWGMRRVQ